ncbi:hypothetical protein WJX72_007227 [[Myrmecia] bisecta]|uniref:Steroid 5-alpha reductase C-terminal domain-containing protein n=1 Tax=[Myrmecia] bisecta TaxID=41462 RepID=A0AAW1PPA4_9CHLO
MAAGLLTLYVVALASTLMGFFDPVLFISVGFGLAMALQGAVLLASATPNNQLTPAAAFHCIALVLYGLRLALYLALRQAGWCGMATYGQAHKKRQGPAEQKSLTARFALWLACSALYLLLALPAYLLVTGERHMPRPAWQTALSFISGALMIVGTVLEAAADVQKSAFKAHHPDRFCQTGLYRLCRHPNFLGDLLFWAASAAQAVAACPCWMHVLSGAASSGIMWYILAVEGAGRMARQQGKRHVQGNSAVKRTRVWEGCLPILDSNGGAFGPRWRSQRRQPASGQHSGEGGTHLVLPPRWHFGLRARK